MNIRHPVKWRNHLSVFLKGICMGVADLVPGISGGTIALITGIYDQLIHNVHVFFHKNTRRFHLKGYWQNIIHLEYGFLIPLALGIGTALLLGSHVVEDLITNYPAPVYSFFLGIILASVHWLMKGLERKHTHWIAFGISVAIGVGIALLGVGLERTSSSWWLIMLMGAVAIPALVLPGISGSYILLVLGHYTLTVRALKTLDFTYLAFFGIGALAGLALLSKFLKHLLTNHRSITLFSLAGLMLGATINPLFNIMEASPGILAFILFLLGLGTFWILQKAASLA